MTSNFGQAVVAILSQVKIQGDELAEIKDLFQKMDTDHDGTLNLKELKEGIKHLHMFEVFQNHSDLVGQGDHFL